MRMRLSLTKEPEIRFVSHLDLGRALERALRRAKLPIAYSEGFNPHMKISFGSALAVGVSSSDEYVDVEFDEESSSTVFAARLSENLPHGIHLKSLKRFDGPIASLSAKINLATYRMEWRRESDTEGVGEDSLRLAVEAFNQASSITHVRRSPKGNRTVEVKQFVTGDMQFDFLNGIYSLQVAINILPQGSLKPSEIVDVFCHFTGISLDGADIMMERTGLYSVSNGDRKSLLEA